MSDNEEESEIEVVPKRKVCARVHLQIATLTTALAHPDRSPKHNGIPGRRERVMGYGMLPGANIYFHFSNSCGLIS